MARQKARYPKMYVDNVFIYGTIFQDAATNDAKVIDIFLPDHPVTVTRIVGSVMFRSTSMITNGIWGFYFDPATNRAPRTFMDSNPVPANNVVTMEDRLSDQILQSNAFSLGLAADGNSTGGPVPVNCKAQRKMEANDVISIFLMSDNTSADSIILVYCFKIFYKEK